MRSFVPLRATRCSSAISAQPRTRPGYIRTRSAQVLVFLRSDNCGDGCIAEAVGGTEAYLLRALGQENWEDKQLLLVCCLGDGSRYAILHAELKTGSVLVHCGAGVSRVNEALPSHPPSSSPTSSASREWPFSKHLDCSNTNDRKFAPTSDSNYNSNPTNACKTQPQIPSWWPSKPISLICRKSLSISRSPT